MKTIVVTNQKGGVGKSTISTHLAFALEEKGQRVLFVDLDPQANSTKTLKLRGDDSNVVASRLFYHDGISLEMSDGITLISADNGMADIERADSKVINNFTAHLSSLVDQYDFCVVDTPPTVGLRMTAALIAADYVLAPIELEEYSIDGITKMLQTIFGVKQQWNPNLNFLGMLPNKFNPNSARQKATFIDLVKSHSHLVIPARIGIRSSIPEALADGMPVWKLKKTAAREASREFSEAFKVVFKTMGVN